MNSYTLTCYSRNIIQEKKEEEKLSMEIKEF